MKTIILWAIAALIIIGGILYFREEQPLPSLHSSSNAAPELQGIAGYINTEPGLTLASLRGKVVLVDFWTYTCINCQRTLPYLTMWDEKYREQGLVIIGVHTPEFEFEKEYPNVLRAVEKFNIKYPVVQDNGYATWRAFGNRFWPHKYLIDVNGNIVYDHIGEGAYAETEQKIQELLRERATLLQSGNIIPTNITTPSSAVQPEFFNIGTPEIYLGYAFDRGGFGYGKIPADTTQSYTIPASPERNKAYLAGRWKSNADTMELLDAQGTVQLTYHAKIVNIVAGAADGALLRIIVDGKEQKNVFVREFDLYQLHAGEDYRERTITIQVEGKGFEISTFTFG
ncbi:thioredoxin family protein [Candidatus Woesearchaeota archaeon]|nr:thioredoxin family protein [Candidatus Woesearchaeota archaeon]